MRYVWRAWVCLHIWEGSRVLNPALKKHLWSLLQQDRRCSWHRMDMGSKSDLYELFNKDFRQKLIIYSAADQRPLWWLFSNPGWLRRAAAWWNVPPRQITNSGNRHKRAGCDSKVAIPESFGSYPQRRYDQRIFFMYTERASRYIFCTAKSPLLSNRAVFTDVVWWQFWRTPPPPKLRQ